MSLKETYKSEVYAIGFGDSASQIADFLKDQIASVPEDGSNKQYAFTATDTAALETVMAEITKEIKNILAKNAKVVDKIPAGFVLTEEAETALKEQYGDKIEITKELDKDGKEITVLNISYDELSSVVGTYTIKYELAAKDDYNGAMYTNESAVLTATATEDNHYYDSTDKKIEIEFDKPVAPISPVTKDDDLTSSPIHQDETLTITKDQILQNDIITEKIEKPVYPNNPEIKVPESTVTNEIIIDAEPTCGTLTKKENGDYLYTPTENCVGEITFTYHVKSTITIFDKDNILTGKEQVVNSISCNTTDENNNCTTYGESSKVTLKVNKRPTSYTVKYLEQGTNKELSPSKKVETGVFVYDTVEEKCKEFEKYNLASGESTTKQLTLQKESTANVIIFYYTKKPVVIDEPETTKYYSLNDGKNTITSLDDPINYTLSVKTDINDFEGDATITFVDTLPYTIDIKKSTLNCDDTNNCSYNYDEKAKTITFTITIKNINTYTNGVYHLNYSHNITLVYNYEGLNGTEEVVTNNLTGIVTVDKTSKTDPADPTPIPIDVKGKVITEYVYIDEDNQEIMIDENLNTEKEYKVGAKYTTIKRSIPGYTFKEVSGKEEGTVTEGITRVVYKYTKDPAEVVVKPSIDKTSTTTIIESSTSNVDYNITYKTTITNYRGTVTLRIIDTLEYEPVDVIINSDGWAIESRVGKIVTFKKEVQNINTYATPDNKQKISDTISYTVKHNNIDGKDKTLKNKAIGQITIEEQTVFGLEDEANVPIAIKGNVEVYYYEKGTSLELSSKTTLYEEDALVGTTYQTEPKTIPGYNLVSNSGNTTGEIKEGIIKVIYYYERRPATPENPVLTKTGTTSITQTTEKVKYNISYEATITNYKGNVKVEIVDYLPFAIKEDSELAGGVYDESTKTIRWTILDETDVTPDKVFNLNVNYDLELSYIGIPASGTSFKNKVNVIITDGTDEEEDTPVEHETIINVKGSVITKHVDDKTGEEISGVTNTTTTGKVGSAYETSPVDIPGYKLKVTPENKIGTYKEGSPIIVTYRYEKLAVKITNEQNNKDSTTTLITSKNQTVDYTLIYSGSIEYRGTVNVILVDKLDYKIDVKNSNLAGGKYDEATNTITWTTEYKDLNTYLSGKPYEFTITKSISLKYIGIPSNGLVKNTLSSYVVTEESKTPELTADKTIKTEIKGSLIVEYVYRDEKNIETTLDSSTNNNLYVDDTYTASAKHFNGYVLSVTPANATGIIKEEPTRVKYIYTRIPAEVEENEVDKESDNEVINNVNDAFDYTIKYNTTIREYNGEATITIVDKLSHPIDAEKSTLNGGLYDPENLTITWTKKYDVDTYNKLNNKISFLVKIKLYYLNLDPTARKVTNKVTTKLELETTPDIEDEDETETKLEVSGKVIVNYVDELGNVIAKQETLTGLVGNDYQTSEKEIEGYVFSEVKGNETGKYIDGEIIVTYVYEKEGTGEIKPPHTNIDNLSNTIIIIISTLLGILIIGRKKILN